MTAGRLPAFLPSMRDRVRLYLAAEPSSTAREIAEEFGRSVLFVCDVLRDLRTAGDAAPVTVRRPPGMGRGLLYLWSLTDEGAARLALRGLTS